jgi:hypothetical protein
VQFIPTSRASPIAGQHQPPRFHCTSSPDGARPSAASAVADTAARDQWPCPTSPEPAIPAAPCTTIPDTTHPIRRLCDTGHTVSVVPIASRHLGRHIEGCAEEEDVISKEATTVHGGQGTQGHHIIEPMLGMRESKAGAHIVSILC